MVDQVYGCTSPGESVLHRGQSQNDNHRCGHLDLMCTKMFDGQISQPFRPPPPTEP